MTSHSSKTSLATLVLTCAFVCTLVGVIQLSEFLIGYEVDSLDMTFYWNLFRRHFFSDRLGLWFDGCGNGLSLLANPLYGLFYFVNGFYTWMSYDQGLRVTYLSHYALFGIGFALWGRQLKLSSASIVVTAVWFCASGIVLSMASRNAPNLFPMVWLPFVGFFALKWFSSVRWFDGFFTGVALGTGYLAGDLQVLAYGILMVLGSWMFVALSGGSSRKRLFLSVPLILAGIAATCGFSLFHAYEAMALSDRGIGLPAEQVLKFSFHPYRIVEFFWPYFFGQPDTPSFWGHAYTSSLIDAQHRWWYGSVYFGLMALPLLVIAAWLGWRERKWRGYGIAALLLAVWSTGIWNPVVKGLVDHVSLLRVVRYPAKALLPACILFFPLIAAATQYLSARIAASPRVGSTNRKRWIYTALILATILPPLFQELPFKMLPPAIHQEPKLLSKIQPGAASPDRVITDIYASPNQHSVINGHLLERGPLFWDRKTFFCPDATITEAQRAVSLDDFSNKDARDNFGVSHIIAGPKLNPPLQTALQRGELTLAQTDPTDGTMLLQATPPPARLVLLAGWKTIMLDASQDVTKILEQPSFRPHQAAINGQLIIDGNGDLTRDDDRVVNWTSNSQSDSCSGTISGAFDSQVGAGQVKVEASCNTYLAINARFTPGWQASVDGHKTWIARLNELMIAIPVPKGNHDVRFEFRPRYYDGFVQVSILLQILMFLFSLYHTSKKQD